MQAAFVNFDGVEAHADVDADMHDLFFLLSAEPDSDAVSELHVAEALGSSTTQQGFMPEGCSPDPYCPSGMIPMPFGPSALKVKQEPMEVLAGLVDVCNSSRACTSSSGGSPSANAAASGGSPVHAPSLSHFAEVQDGILQAPSQHRNLPPVESTPLPAVTAMAATATMTAATTAAAAALSERMPEVAPASTQSDSTDALYDMVQSKPSPRSFGRSSTKKLPLSHSTIEKHRRDRINHLIDELGEMVPPIDPRYRGEGAEAAGLKRPKHAVLADVVTRYRQLQAENESLHRQLAAAGLQASRLMSGSGSGSGPQQPSAAAAAQRCQVPVAAVPPQLPQAAAVAALPVTAPKVAAPTAAATSTPNCVAAAAARSLTPAVAAPLPAPAIPSEGVTAPAAAASGAYAAVVTAPCGTAGYVAGAGDGVPIRIPAAAAASPLLSAAAAAGASDAQLPSTTAAATAAAAMAASAQPDFVPVMKPGPNTAVAAGLCSLYPEAVVAAAESNPSGMQGPSIVMMPRPAATAAALPLAGCPEAWTATCDTVTAAVPSPSSMELTTTTAKCPRECATASPVAVHPPMAVGAAALSPPAWTDDALPQGGGQMKAQPPPVAGDGSSNGADSSSTEVHVCRANVVKSKPTAAVVSASHASNPAAAASSMGPSRRLAASRDPAHNSSASTPFLRSTTAAPSRSHVHAVGNSAAAASTVPLPPAAAELAAAAATSSWLVRVVCPPRQDVLSAACRALADAGVSLRSARTASAPGGRIALELEVCCEEGVLPRGMQVGHIQCAIYAALQVSTGADAGGACEEEDVDDDSETGGRAAAATAAAGARTAATSRAGSRKRHRV